MKRTLSASLTQCRHGQPLVVFHEALIGLDDELRPEHLRQIAERLEYLAHQAEQGQRGWYIDDLELRTTTHQTAR